ncbi:hypothetical protein G4Z05_00405 [Bacillus thermocopriae]|uniref:Uncharacterized protein n=1 Tax=Neobacillus thermocopriae TaxID=1215031 RepID=A0A6B3TKA8_9BACI|nr:hypothetical protein [Neobacillus thermocopriae]NEX77364.1 hypothetical protein [Neobacillus thermocopriae]
MNPLEKKQLLKEQFKKRIQARRNQKVKTISFKELGITFEPETIEWYKSVENGGVKFD